MLDYEVQDSHMKQAKETMAMFKDSPQDIVHVIADQLAEIEALKIELGIWV
jgi:hypothetical protein